MTLPSLTALNATCMLATSACRSSVQTSQMPDSMFNCWLGIPIWFQVDNLPFNMSKAKLQILIPPLTPIPKKTTFHLWPLSYHSRPPLSSEWCKPNSYTVILHFSLTANTKTFNPPGNCVGTASEISKIHLTTLHCGLSCHPLLPGSQQSPPNLSPCF